MHYTVTLLVFCLVPLFLLGGSALLVVLFRRRAEATASSDPIDTLHAFEAHIESWMAQGRLNAVEAAPILALIRADLRLAPAGGFMPAPAEPERTPQPATTAVPGEVPRPVPAQRPGTAPLPPTALEQPALPDAAGPSLAPPRLAWREQIGAALLTLRTRRTLLYLGAFLLVVSALTLVLFSWASFSPLAQFGLLAGVCAGLWGGGAWLTRQTGLYAAGRNLQTIASLLLPLTGFALARPGLLDLDPRTAWLLASALSLAFYMPAAWWLRQRFYAVAAAIATLSTLLAALRPLENQWLPVAAILLLAAYVPLAWWLRRRNLPQFAAGPFWVAQIGLPPLLLVSCAGGLVGLFDLPVVAVSLGGGTLAYLAWCFSERRPAYAWVTSLLAPAAILASLSSFDQFDREWLLPLAALLLAAYVPLAWWLRRRNLPQFAAAPFWVLQFGLPPLLFVALDEAWSVVANFPVATSTLWIGVGAYASLLFSERRPLFAWISAGLIPLALLATLDSFAVAYTGMVISLALLALVYLGIGVAAELRGRWYALPFYVGVAVLALLASSASVVDGDNTARLALPLLLLLSGLVVWLRERGQFAAFGAGNATAGAVLGLLLIGLCMPAWMFAMLELSQLPYSWYIVILMLPALPSFALSSWWLGRLRVAYDITLQLNGVLILLVTATIAWFLPTIQPWAAGLAAGIWLFQALLRRQALWAVPALGALLLAVVRAIDPRQLPPFSDQNWLIVLLAISIVYAVAGTALRRSAWRYWTPAALAWAALAGLLALAQIGSAWLANGQFSAAASMALASLALLAALLGAAWRQPLAGYPAALLAAAALMAAATRDFFSPWHFDAMYYGLLLSSITLSYGLLGQFLRQHRAQYAYPYEQVALGLLVLAPLPALGDARAGCLTFLAFGTLFALATWRYRLNWLALPAFAALDMVLLYAARWLVPAGDPAGAAYLLLGAAWFQGLYALAARRGRATLLRQTAMPAYLMAALSSAAALIIVDMTILRAANDHLPAVFVGLGITLLAALIASMEEQEPLAWGALLPATYTVAHYFAARELALPWALAWGVLVALGFSLLGWLLSFAGSRLRVWREPLLLGPLAAGVVLVGALALLSLPGAVLSPLTFALANLGLLLATLAVRERRFVYVYSAGAAFVAAGLCQLADWGFREPQWYVLPAGLYLLALAEGIRRFQGQQQVARVIDAGALLLMLGTTLGQALRNSDVTATFYTLLLCGESLLMVAYGTMRKLRVPFVGGIGFFVAGVLWLSVDPLRSANQWMLIGGVGLLLVVTYVLLERRQEQLVRSGRMLMEQLRSWQ